MLQMWLLCDFYFQFNLTIIYCSVLLYVLIRVTCTHLRLDDRLQVGSKWWMSRTDIVSSNSEMTDVNPGSLIATDRSDCKAPVSSKTRIVWRDWLGLIKVTEEQWPSKRVYFLPFWNHSFIHLTLSARGGQSWDWLHWGIFVILISTSLGTVWHNMTGFLAVIAYYTWPVSTGTVKLRARRGHHRLVIIVSFSRAVEWNGLKAWPFVLE